MDAKALCRKDKQGRFVICADDLYPAAIEHIQEQLEREIREIPQHLRQLYSQAKRIPEALADMSDEALEVARKWFTRLLKDQIGDPFVLKIVPGKDRERWKL